MSRRVSRSPARIFAALGVALTMGASGLLSDPASVTAMARPGDGPGGSLAWLDLGAQFASMIPRSLLGGATLNYGSDNRLTVLLLGSDTRKAGNFSRTDTIMIVSIAKNSNTINVASIPRDTARILNPFTPSTTDYFTPRVNGILKLLRKGHTNAQAFSMFEQVIENELGLPAGTIDYYALITFDGFDALVENVQPITLNIDHTIADPKFWDNPHLPPGVYFPAQNNYQLYAWQQGVDPPLCDSLWKGHNPVTSQYWCHRALPFVRSRKGSGNSDWKRAQRQQNLVGAAITRVIQRGSASALDSLVTAADGQVASSGLYTDIPFDDLGVKLELYNLLNGAHLVNQVVFAPSWQGVSYASHIPGGTAYQLKLPAVQGWADTYLQ